MDNPQKFVVIQGCKFFVRVVSFLRLAFALALDFLPDLAPLFVETIQLMPKSDDDFDQFGEGVAKSASAVVAKNMGVLMEKDGERVSKVFLENPLCQKDLT